jgi:hypothetical protein
MWLHCLLSSARAALVLAISQQNVAASSAHGRGQDKMKQRYLPLSALSLLNLLLLCAGLAANCWGQDELRQRYPQLSEDVDTLPVIICTAAIASAAPQVLLPTAGAKMN